MDNMKYVLHKHPRYDIEALYAIRTFGRHLGRVRLYGDAIDACRRQGLGRPDALPEPLRAALATQRCLVIGYGVSRLALAEGSHTFDQDAPLGATNSHLLGLALQQFKTGQFAMVVNIDLWRFFLPEDLSVVLARALRKAGRLELVATSAEVDQVAMLPAPFIADLGYVADMLRPHFDVALTRYERATLLTVR
jgi:hypothetical protein